MCTLRAGEKWEKQNANSDFKTRSERGLHRQYGEMGGTIERSGDAGEALLDAQGGSGTLSERQDVLTDLMERKMNMQKTAPEKDQEKIPEEPKELEWQTKEALELVQRKLKLMSAGLLHKNLQAYSMEGRNTDPEERRRQCEVVRPL